jgi:hypothetical protein
MLPRATDNVLLAATDNSAMISPNTGSQCFRGVAAIILA